MNHYVEKKWKNGKYQCVVLMLLRSNGPSHRCGYVKVNKKHPLYKKDCSEHCECLEPFREEILSTPISKRGILPLFCWDKKRLSPEIFFDVHGGVTYSKGNVDYPIKTLLPRWWFGFDCAHVGDTIETCTLEYCVDECNRLAEQLRKVETLRR